MISSSHDHCIMSLLWQLLGQYKIIYLLNPTLSSVRVFSDKLLRNTWLIVSNDSLDCNITSLWAHMIPHSPAWSSSQSVHQSSYCTEGPGSLAVVPYCPPDDENLPSWVAWSHEIHKCYQCPNKVKSLLNIVTLHNDIITHDTSSRNGQEK